MSYARVVTSATGQRIELPDEMRLEADEVEVRREGDLLTLRPSRRTYGERLVETLEHLSDLIEIPEDMPAQRRPGL